MEIFHIHFSDEAFLDVPTDTLLVGVAHEKQLRVGRVFCARLLGGAVRVISYKLQVDIEP